MRQNFFGPVRCHDDMQLLHVVEDAAIGLVAIVARLFIASWLYAELAEDGQGIAVTSQLVAAVCSAAHWFVRFVVLERGNQSPLTKIGGSTALVDAPSAVMLAFARAPLLTSSIGRFDATARLLTCLLLTIVSLQRILFASACVGHLLERAGCHAMAYRAIIMGAAAQWLVQSVCLAILIANVFATPLAFSCSRSLPGDSTPLAASFFLAATAAALPQILRSAKKLL